MTRLKKTLMMGVALFAIANIVFLANLVRRETTFADQTVDFDFDEPPKPFTLNAVAPPALRGRGVVVSVISVLIKKDEHHLHGFLDNLIKQTIFKNVEVLVATFEGKISEQAVQDLEQYEKQYQNIRRVHFQVDGGLYTAWSDLARNYSQGAYITNCNPDDRRPRDSFERQVAFLESNPGVALVCGPVRACYDLHDPDSIDWLTSDRCQTWNGDNTFEIRLYDLFEYDVFGRYVRGRNPPHNAPMWRRTLHDKAGYFDEKFQPYSDHLLWLRAVAAGERAFKVSGPPHALYSVHMDSHNRQKKLEQQAAEQRVLFDLMKFQLHQGLRPLNIVVMHESLSVFSGGDIRILQLLRFLSSQGHRVFYIARLPYEPDGVAVIAPYVVAYSLYDQPMHAVAEWMSMGITFDVAIMGTWFYKPLSIPEVIVPRFRARSPRTVLVALTDDIHAIRRPQMDLLKCCESCTDPPTTGADLDLCNLSLEREINVYRSVDLVLTIAEEDAATIRSLMHQPTPIVEVFPFVESQVATTAPTPQSRNTVLWCAAFHTANEIAFQWFIRDVWPKFIKHVPGAKLVVIGYEWEKYTKDVRMERLDRVVSLEPELARARVLVNPVTVYGSGISTKTVLGFARGVPTLTQPAGVRGLTCKENDGSALFPHIASDDSAATFLDRMLRLFKQDSYWSEVSSLQLSFARACLTEAAQYRETAFTGMLRSLASRPAPGTTATLLPPQFEPNRWLEYASRPGIASAAVDKQDKQRAATRAACDAMANVSLLDSSAADERSATYLLGTAGTGNEWFRKLLEMATGVKSLHDNNRRALDGSKADARAVVVQGADGINPQLEPKRDYRLIVLLRQPLESLWASFVNELGRERMTVEEVVSAGEFARYAVKHIRTWAKTMSFAMQFKDSPEMLPVNYEKLVLFRKREITRVVNFLGLPRYSARTDCLDVVANEHFYPSLMPSAQAVFRAHCGLVRKLLPIIFSTDIKLLGLSFTPPSLLEEYDCEESLAAFMAKQDEDYLSNMDMFEDAT